MNYWLPLDIGTGLGVILVPAACILARRCRVPLSSAIALCLLLLLYVASPFGYKGTLNLDSRFMVMFALLLFAGLTPIRLPRALGYPVAAIFVVGFFVRMAVLTSAWAAHNTDLAAFRAVIRSVPPGSTVFLAAADITPAYRAAEPLARRLSDGATTDVHLAALLPIERRAWWPSCSTICPSSRS